MKAHWINSGVSQSGFKWIGGDTVDPRSNTKVEALIGEPNYKDIWWLELAIKRARSVARVKFPNGSATGFMVGPDLFMTNHHVFETKEDADLAIIQFNYRLLENEDLAPRDDWRCDSAGLFKTNPDLDYSLVRVKSKDGKRAGDVWGFLNLGHGAGVMVNQRVNIIQHPQGRFQEIAFRDNQVKAVENLFIQYLTDTEYGSSGSPVFDDWFNVVALHNQRVRDPANPDRWHRNQGYRVEAILADAGDIIPASG
jgi:endonuclease G